LATPFVTTRYLDDFRVSPLTHLWDDTVTSGFSDKKVYVVQTNPSAIERCLLMTTDPGDLVLDPTCGSGTTAFVAEKWGRRWITCDTSRVAVTLARQRLMTASFDYFELRYPHEGIKGGFFYKTVPHVTLKSIANNPEIDEIHARMHPAVAAALAGLDAALVGWVRPQAVTHRAGATSPKDGGLRDKAANPPYEALREWEVPFDFPASGENPWPEAARQPFAVFHTARQAMQRQMDASIAAHADQETLYDQPQKAKNKLRITGPFTVEAVPFPSVKALDTLTPGPSPGGRGEIEADISIARSGESARQHQWRDELLKTGIRGKGGQMFKFADLETLPDTTYLHAVGNLDSGERVAVSFGPEHAALEQRQVEMALREAEKIRPMPRFIVFAAFAFDPEAAKDIDEMKWPGVALLKAQMNTDLLTEDLKKARANNQSFWLMGQPDVEVRKLPSPPAPLPQGEGSDWYEVEVNGFDYFDTAKGELVSGGKNQIAVWSLDTDYDERSLFPRQVFFPMAGKGEGWEKLKKDIRAELDEGLLSQFQGTVSLPFAAGENRKIAVKIVDDRGIESLKIVALN
jgi:adenine-specific DNA-methyltransferase